MKRVIEHIEQRKSQVAEHRFYRWMGSARASLYQRFDFAPVLVNFIMAFPDMNRWFMRYPAAANEYERAINKHTREDETHSGLYLEDWRKLALDQRLGWTAGDTLAWYHASPETERFRANGMEVLGMLVRNDDPLVRFALMESIEAWGHVMFSATTAVADELTMVTGDEYRYFGRYHLKRELGHLLAGGRLFEQTALDENRLGRAIALVDRLFDIAVDESQRLLAYAEQVIDGDGSGPRVHLAHHLDGHGVTSHRQDRATPSPAAARLQRLLDERKRSVARHPLFAWMRGEDSTDPATKLRQLALFWAPWCLGYRDLTAHALAFARPTHPTERAINRWTVELGSHHRLFLQDWAALGIDERLGFSASDTLELYCRSQFSEVQRRSMSSFVELAFRHPDPASRFWLLEALEGSGEAFFAGTRALAQRVEPERGVRLDYFCGRHQASHPVLEPDSEADAVDFKGAVLDPEREASAAYMIDTVFDCLEQQLSTSLQARSGALLS